MSLQHVVQRQVQIRSDQRQDGLAAQVLHVPDVGADGNLDGEVEPAAGEGDRDGRLRARQEPDVGRGAEHAVVELAGGDALQHAEQGLEVLVVGLDVNPQLRRGGLDHALLLHLEDKGAAHGVDADAECHVDGGLGRSRPERGSGEPEACADPKRRATLQEAAPGESRICRHRFSLLVSTSVCCCHRRVEPRATRSTTLRD